MADNKSPNVAVQPTASQKASAPIQSAITQYPAASEKPPIDWGGSVWDISNSMAATVAIFISVYVTWSSNRAKEFDDEYGNDLMSGCSLVKEFLNKISVVANIADQSARHREANDLLELWNIKMHPLLNALKYADDHLLKDSKTDEWSNCGLAISDNVGEMLVALSATSGANWNQTYTRSRKDVTKELSELHGKIKTARKRASTKPWLICIAIFALIFFLGLFLFLNK